MSEFPAKLHKSLEERARVRIRLSKRPPRSLLRVPTSRLLLWRQRRGRRAGPRELSSAENIKKSFSFS